MSYHDRPLDENAQMPLFKGTPPATATVDPDLAVGDVVTWRTKRKSGLSLEHVEAMGRISSMKRKWAHVRSWGVDYRVKLEDLTWLATPDDGWDPDKKNKKDWRNFKTPDGHSER